MPRRIPIPLAIVASLFYLLHAAELVILHPASNLLWSCNVASLAVVVGLCLDRAAPVAVGCFLLTMGNVIWVLDMVSGGETTWTAPLTHVGVYALGLWGIRRLGLPRHAWWQSAGLLTLATFAARIAGPAEENINFAFDIPKGWSAFGVSMEMVPEVLSPWARTHAIYILFLTAVFILNGLAHQWLLPHLGFPRTPPDKEPARD